VVVEVDVEVGGRVVAGVVAGMINGDVAGVGGVSLDLEVVAGLGGDGVEVV